ncbi:MAG: cytochrome P450 [Pseudomonadota bacterium]
MHDLANATLFNPNVLNHPYALYKKLRHEAPVHFDEQLQAYLVTRYADVQQAARMTDELSNELGFDKVMRSEWQDEIDEMMWREGFGPHIISNTLQVDPPKHARRRKLLNNSFNARTVAAMEPAIYQVAMDSLSAFLHSGEADLMREYALPIPIVTICDLLNFPRDRIEEMSLWADSAVAQLSMTGTREEAFGHARNVMALQRFVMNAIDQRREQPGDDLISQLIHAKIDDAEQPCLTPEELMPMCLIVVAGGIDTTRNGIAWGCYNLAKDPELFSLLKNAEDQDKLLKQFVEETLRQQTVVPQLPRFAKKDCEIGGVSVPEGSSVFLSWGSANHDEQRFPEPEKLDIFRKNAGTHAAFGAGIHRCIGNMLARMEMKCAFKALLNNLETVDLLVASADVELDASLVLRGPASLPCRLQV